jgi:predicted metal-dependent peptidase
MTNNSKITYLEECCQTIINQLMAEKLFLPLALELAKCKIVICDENNFALKEETFAYYSPLEETIYIDGSHPVFTSPRKIEILQSRIILILLHEVLHKFLDHAGRVYSRDNLIWNIACDFEIHNLLYLYSDVYTTNNNPLSRLEGYFKNILEMFKIWDEGKQAATLGDLRGLFSSKYLENTAEEIYEELQKTATIKQKKYFFPLTTNGKIKSKSSKIDDDQLIPGVFVEVEEIEVTLPRNKKYTQTNIIWPTGNLLPKNLRKSQLEKEETRSSMELNKALAERNLREFYSNCSIGRVGQYCNILLDKTFPTKLDWSKILESSLTCALETSDYFTWSRPRTSLWAMNIYLPDVEKDISKYGTVIFVRDESGSLSNDNAAKTCDVLRRASEKFSHLVLIKHDTKIASIEEFDTCNEDFENSIVKRVACGGTSHKEVFEEIQKYYQDNQENDEKQLSCVILFTDCYSDIEKYQNTIDKKIPLIYLVPKENKSATKNIRGKIILI